jgi:hypothetical protein
MDPQLVGNLGIHLPFSSRYVSLFQPFSQLLANSPTHVMAYARHGSSSSSVDMGGLLTHRGRCGTYGTKAVQLEGAEHSASPRNVHLAARHPPFSLFRVRLTTVFNQSFVFPLPTLGPTLRLPTDLA